LRYCHNFYSKSLIGSLNDGKTFWKLIGDKKGSQRSSNIHMDEWKNHLEKLLNIDMEGGSENIDDWG